MRAKRSTLHDTLRLISVATLKGKPEALDQSGFGCEAKVPRGRGADRQFTPGHHCNGLADNGRRDQFQYSDNLAIYSKDSGRDRLALKNPPALTAT